MASRPDRPTNLLFASWRLASWWLAPLPCGQLVHNRWGVPNEQRSRICKKRRLCGGYCIYTTEYTDEQRGRLGDDKGKMSLSVRAFFGNKVSAAMTFFIYATDRTGRPKSGCVTPRNALKSSRVLPVSQPGVIPSAGLSPAR